MKKLSSLLAILLLLQSCSVYHPGSVSVHDAVAASGKVKIITEDQKRYKFRRLEQENDRLIGITKRGSAAAKKAVGLPATYQGKVLKVDLSDVGIEEIKLRNNSLSTILSIAIPIVLAFGGLIGLAAIFMDDTNWGVKDSNF